MKKKLSILLVLIMTLSLILPVQAAVKSHWDPDHEAGQKEQVCKLIPNKIKNPRRSLQSTGVAKERRRNTKKRHP